MVDYNKIVQLLYRWCAAHDARDLQSLGAVVTADVEMFQKVGREAALNEISETYAKMPQQRRHVLTNTIILEEEEGEVLTQSYIQHYQIKDDKVWLNYTGIYRVLCVLQDGKWLIRRHEDFPDVTFRAEGAADRPAAGVLQSTRVF